MYGNGLIAQLEGVHAHAKLCGFLHHLSGGVLVHAQSGDHCVCVLLLSIGEAVDGNGGCTDLYNGQCASGLIYGYGLAALDRIAECAAAYVIMLKYTSFRL